MNREAIKFKDLNGFLSVTTKMGFNGEIKALLFEEGEPPYCTAYFVPTNLLPSTFDMQAIGEFGGSITEVEDFHYIGPDDPSRDFMVFPKSSVGYLEVESAPEGISTPEWLYNTAAIGEMVYVINLEDGGGQEFYLSTANTLVRLGLPDQEPPKQFKTHRQVNKQLDEMRAKYLPTCQVYAMEWRDFELRLKANE